MTCGYKLHTCISKVMVIETLIKIKGPGHSNIWKWRVLLKWRVCAYRRTKTGAFGGAFRRNKRVFGCLKKSVFGVNFPKKGSFDVNLVTFQWKFAIFSCRNVREAHEKFEICVEILEKGSLGVDCSEKRGHFSFSFLPPPQCIKWTFNLRCSLKFSSLLWKPTCWYRCRLWYVPTMHKSIVFLYFDTVIISLNVNDRFINWNYSRHKTNQSAVVNLLFLSTKRHIFKENIKPFRLVLT